MIKRFDVFEEVVKEVVPFGNGSIVYTPKKWVGQTVRVILEGEPLNLRESIMEPLQPFLEHVKGVFLHGSFARNEQSRESDIDVLVVADEKFVPEKKGRLDFTVISEAVLRKELAGKDPFYVYNILQEARPILNESLLKELKGIKIDKRNFKWLLDESESALKIAKEFLELDRQQKRETLDSTAIIYTMVLRLKRLFMVQRVLENKKYSNKGFKEFMESKGLAKELVERTHKIYGAERDERKAAESISIQETGQLYEVVENELKKMKGEYRCRQKRKN
ncbi:MAG: DUF2080 family transposase-associated protein [Candidatus Diapherotrites archaeon]